jgi:hypothetical protein
MRRFDGGFWAHHIRSVFVREIRAFERAVVERMLPAFNGLEQEADALADSEYERLGSLPARDDIDMADLAEMAQDAGLSHYEELTGVRQAILNLCAAALFHIVEQQLLLFHRRQVLHPSEEYDSSLFSWKTIHERFSEAGVSLKGLRSWPSLHELECVANVVKHGDGRSADELRKIRPEVMIPEVLRGENGILGGPTPYVRTPLTGDSVHVTVDDFRRYAQIASGFWDEVADAIAAVD